jgi:GNAT superfamily N-acetyltransferase
MFDRALTVRIERWSAATAVRFAGVLADADPSWGTRTAPLAGGRIVLCGPGLYVNRAIAAGLDAPLQLSEIEQLVDMSTAVGVPPAIEVTDATHPGTVDALTQHGFEPDPDRQVSVCSIELDRFDLAFTELPALERLEVADSSLERWMEVSAEGWGHVGAEARHAADTFARVAHRTGDRLLMAIDTTDGRPLGCASLTIAGGVANLGGMSTIPSERGRGVQSALIRHRLEIARQLGCSLAISSARTGGASERNLHRHGFVATHLCRTWVRR